MCVLGTVGGSADDVGIVPSPRLRVYYDPVLVYLYKSSRYYSCIVQSIGNGAVQQQICDQEARARRRAKHCSQSASQLGPCWWWNHSSAIGDKILNPPGPSVVLSGAAVGHTCTPHMGTTEVWVGGVHSPHHEDQLYDVRYATHAARPERPRSSLHVRAHHWHLPRLWQALARKTHSFTTCSLCAGLS